MSRLCTVVRYLWKVSAGQRGRIALCSGLGLLNVFLALAFVWSSKQVIDVATGTTPGSLWQMGALTAGLLALQLLVSVPEGWLNSRMQVEGSNALRRRIFARLLQSRWNELERFHTGDVMNRVEQDSNAVTELLAATLPSAVTTIAQLLASFLFFCLLDPWLPWLLVAILPLLLLAGRFYMKRMRRYTREIRRSDSHIQSVIQESIQHHTVVKTLEQEDHHLEKLDALQETLRTQIDSRTRFSLLSRSLAAFAFSGGYLMVFLWGAYRLSQGSITFGTMTAFLQLVGKIQRPVFDLARMLPAGVTAVTATERLMELEALTAEEEGDPVAFETTPDIVWEEVSFAYPGQREAIFDRFSFRLSAGSRAAITGETGRGKTTLFRLLLALAAPTGGRIYLTNGKHQVPVSPRTRCNFVYVPQGNTLFSGTIRDNLLMGRPEATQEEMEKALRTSVADFVFTLPQGIDTLLGEKGNGLSEGQAQRIAIARALLRPGNILLLDEATSALDVETERLLMENLQRENGGKTVIFITHHPAVAEECEERLAL